MTDTMRPTNIFLNANFFTPEHRLHRQSLALALKQLLYGVNTAIDPRSNHHEYKPKLHLQRHR